MKNEKILIFGDSYSTFAGYVPKDYHVYYPVTSSGKTSDVSDVSLTWWGALAQETGSEIVLNNSWSGSTICNTPRESLGLKSTFISRLTELIQAGFFEKNPIDRVFVFGATNDSWIGTAVGEVQFSDWSEDDLKSILPGICFFIDRLLSAVDRKKVHFIINTGIKAELLEAIPKICQHYNIGYTALSNIDKVSGHPTAKGMAEIKDQVLSGINSHT